MTEYDDELDDNALSDIYTQFSREEPSDELDDRVLSAAKKAVASEKAAAKKVRGPFSGQWRVPVSLAAVIVLSVIVVVTIEREHFDTLTSAPEQSIVQPEAPPATDHDDVPSRGAALAPQEESTAEPASKPAPVTEQRAPAIANEAPELTEKKQQSASPVHKSKVVPQRLAKPALPAKPQKQPASPVSGSSAPQASDGDAGANTSSNLSRDVKQQRAPVFFSNPYNRKITEAKQQANEQKKSISSSGLPAAPPMLAQPAPEALRQKQPDSEQVERKQRPSKAFAEAPAGAPTAMKSDADNTTKTNVAQATDNAPVAAAEPSVPEAKTAGDIAAAQARSEAHAASQGEADRSATTRVRANAADETSNESVAAADQPVPEAQSAAIAAVPAEAKPEPKSKLLKEEQTPTQSSAALSPDTAVDQQLQLSGTAGAVAAAPQDSDIKVQSQSSQSGGNAETPCERFSELACYVSARCTLQWLEEQKAYNCRDADNVCEQDFSQADNNRQDCENNPACVYVPANCYCAPNTKCECGGGPPAMCTTKKQP
jgi:hypothetical protein